MERVLPILPMVVDYQQLWQPSDDTRGKLMGRLLRELERRNQSIPEIPEFKPAASIGSARRATLRVALASRTLATARSPLSEQDSLA